MNSSIAINCHGAHHTEVDTLEPESRTATVKLKASVEASVEAGVCGPFTEEQINCTSLAEVDSKLAELGFERTSEFGEVCANGFATATLGYKPTHDITADELREKDHSIVAEGVTFSIPGVKGMSDYTRYTLGLSPAGRPARQVYQGPLVDELFGYLFAEAAVIAAEPIIDRRRVITAYIGDTVRVAGHGTFRIVAPKRYEHTPKLEVVS